jgi:phage regulator Rha-like protein
MTFKFELTQDDFDLLLLMGGYGTGAALEQGKSELAHRFIELRNRLNTEYPEYRPYATDVHKWN